MPMDGTKLRTRYQRSAELLARACNVIPLGSQTFSKSKLQYPSDVSPHFIVRGLGSRVWDVDGNEYVDFINSLASISLGHGDPDVTAAVRRQLEDGVIFSLPHPIETQVAEKLRELVPCAEMTRFGKNGSDVTSAAIRLARAYTSRDHVLVCGYHGWQDWYIGTTTRMRGVPKVVQDLTHSFTFGDVGSVDKLFRQYPNAVAAVILEPMNVVPPPPEFFQELQELTHRNGALLILDEMLTGFRYSIGGAQSTFGITPDLATFGKSMANGYPISAVTGRMEVMSLFEDVFFSLTFGGETLSLAAALATMTKMVECSVIQKLYLQGEKVSLGVQRLILKHEIGHIVSISGNPTLSFLTFSDVGQYSQWAIKTLFLQEILARGLLTFGIHILSYSHEDSEVAHLLKVYDDVFPLLRRAVDEGAMDKLLMTKPLAPVFRIR